MQPAASGDYRRLAALSNEELERRLVEDPDKITDRDMIVISGVAADKLARLKAQPSSGPSPISQLFKALHQAGKLTVEQRVSYEPKDPVQEAVDVTPESVASVAPGSSGSEV